MDIACTPGSIAPRMYALQLTSPWARNRKFEIHLPPAATHEQTRAARRRGAQRAMREQPEWQAERVRGDLRHPPFRGLAPTAVEPT